MIKANPVSVLVLIPLLALYVAYSVSSVYFLISGSEQISNTANPILLLIVFINIILPIVSGILYLVFSHPAQNTPGKDIFLLETTFLVVAVFGAAYTLFYGLYAFTSTDVSGNTFGIGPLISFLFILITGIPYTLVAYSFFYRNLVKRKELSLMIPTQA